MVLGTEGEAMFQVTEAAADHILGTLAPASRGRPVRVSLTTVSGCGDKKLTITPDAAATWDDSVLHEHGVVLIADLKVHKELSGATLDLSVEGLNKRLVVRSAVLASCGCGTSYSSKKSET